jgi:DnaK suppressor protein
MAPVKKVVAPPPAAKAKAKASVAKAPAPKATASKKTAPVAAKAAPAKKPAAKPAVTPMAKAAPKQKAAASAVAKTKAPAVAVPPKPQKAATAAKPAAAPASKPAVAATPKPVIAATPAPAPKPAKPIPARTAAPAPTPVAAAAPAAEAPAAAPTSKLKSRLKPLRKPVATASTPVKAVPVEPEKPRFAPRPGSKVTIVTNVELPAGYRPSSGEEYMSPFHLAYFRQILEGQRQQLIGDSQKTIEHLRTETRDVGDEAERASRESDNILELRTRDRERKLLRKIEEALKRIDDGSYGYCEETGEEIGLGRLEARPTATLTVDAQERREKLQKQFRDDH